MVQRLKTAKGVFGRFTRLGADNSVQPSGRGPFFAPPELESSDALFDRLEKFWYYSERGVSGLKPEPATADQIAEFESRNGVALPADLREYFLRFNGTNGDGDSQLFAFWQIEKLSPFPSSIDGLLEPEHHFIFADYMIESWYYAIYLGDDPALQHRVIMPDFPGHPTIAPDFSSFLELYLRDAPALYGS